MGEDITQGSEIQINRKILELTGEAFPLWLVMPEPWQFELVQSKRKFKLLAQMVTHSLALIQFEDDGFILQMDWCDILLNARRLEVK
jgi:hypothetical protein